MRYFENTGIEDIVDEINGVVYAEEWKPVVDCDYYEVSSFGRVKSCRKNLILRSAPHTGGYRTVHIGSKKLNQNRCCYVHRLVAQHFNDNPCNKPEVNHDDGDKTNNFFSNLLWSTESENLKHSYDKLGRINPKPSLGISGFSHASSKPVNQLDRETGAIVSVWGSIHEAAKHFNCNPSSIMDVLKGRWPTCKGYKWSYADISLNAFKPRNRDKYDRRIQYKKNKKNKDE